MFKGSIFLGGSEDTLAIIISPKFDLLTSKTLKKHHAGHSGVSGWVISNLLKVTVTLSLKEPTPEDFIFNSGGAFILKRRLNYNVSPKYNFTVTAQASHSCVSRHSEGLLYMYESMLMKLTAGCHRSLQDVEGLNDTATVLFDVEDYDNLNPYFSHNVYQAFISENQVSPTMTF